MKPGTPAAHDHCPSPGPGPGRGAAAPGNVTRAAFIRGIAATGVLSSTGLAACRNRKPAVCGAAAPTPPKLRGVNYDTGTNYAPSELSRLHWNHALMEQELRRIEEELHCNAVHIYGSELERLRETAAAAAARGLHVVLQPRLVESTLSAQLTHLGQLAQEAEELARRCGAGSLTLDLGCELSIFSSGIIPGATFTERIDSLIASTPAQLREYNRKLEQHLAQALEISRSRFAGQLTYGSGIWETVDWNGFDVVGVHMYRDAANQATYLEDLRAYRKWQKPVYVLEFGCTTHLGADLEGTSSDGIVVWDTPIPTIAAGAVRSEQTQADYDVDLLRIFEAEGIPGAFLFELIEPSYPHSPTPMYDLDMASFGLLKAVRERLEDPTSPYEALPKLAFDAVARFHAAT